MDLLKETNIVGKWDVKHSESKDAYNIVATVLGDKYKIARLPYIVGNDEFQSNKNKIEALEMASIICKAPEMYRILQRLLIEKVQREDVEIILNDIENLKNK